MLLLIGLLNGHARARVVFRADKLWINFHPAGAKEPLHAVTERGVQRFTQNRIGSRGRIIHALRQAGWRCKRVWSRVRPKASSAMMSELSQRRIGAVRHAEAFAADRLIHASRW